MIQLRPTETFTIARQIDDPLDTNTYYIQGYVRNATTDDLLKTVNLTDKGDQRFRGDWEVPVDGSGLGFYITITTKVYTDSGYTSESDLYGREERQYLVQDRMDPNSGVGKMIAAASGADINYKKIREIVKDELEKRKMQEIELDITPVLNAISEVSSEIMMIDMPKPEKVELGGILSELLGVKKSIEGIIIPEQKETDLKPTTTQLMDIKSEVTILQKAVKQVITALEKDKSTYTKILNKEIKDKVNWVNGVLDIKDIDNKQNRKFY